MAKGNMLLGYARGKVGDLVFTRRNGEQVTRPRVRVVNNPKTEGQQIQRMIFASVIWAYQRMKSICDHSFEGVKYGADSQARFMSENLKALRAYYPTSADPRALAEMNEYETMAFSLPNNKAAAGVGLIVSRGSIPEPLFSTRNGVFEGWGGQMNTVAISDVMAALHLQAGDQLTVFTLIDDGNMFSFDKSRYVLKSELTTEELAEIWKADGTAAAFDAEKTEISRTRLVAEANQPLKVIDVAENAVACGLIISRRDANGNWLRSNSRLYNLLDEAPQYQADYALPFWQFSGTDITTEDPHYLNNADA